MKPAFAKSLLRHFQEGSPAGVKETQAVGYLPVDSGKNQRVDVDLLPISVSVQQHAYEQTGKLLPIQPDRITTDQAYLLFFLRGQVAYPGCGSIRRRT